MQGDTLIKCESNQGEDEMCHITGCGETNTPYVYNKTTLLCKEHAPEN